MGLKQNMTQIADDVEELVRINKELFHFIDKQIIELESKYKTDIIAGFDLIEIRNLKYKLEDLINKISK